jgi:hypothetical protein
MEVQGMGHGEEEGVESSADKDERGSGRGDGKKSKGSRRLRLVL